MIPAAHVLKNRIGIRNKLMRCGVAFVVVVFASFIALTITSKTQAATYDLTTDFNLRIDGENNTKLGFPNAQLGDIDGNGYADLILQRTSELQIYVIMDDILQNYLNTKGAILDLSDSSNYSFRITDSSSGFGIKDINNDGYVELVFNRFSDDVLGKTDNGAIYILDGRMLKDIEDGTTISVIDPDIYSYMIAGSTDGDRLGFSTISFGDFDGDGKTDLSAPTAFSDYAAANVGSVYLIPNENILLGTYGNILDLSDENSYDYRIDGEVTGEFNQGLSNAIFIDIDKDGHDGVAVSCQRCSTNGLTRNGLIYVIPENRFPSHPNKIINLADSANYSALFQGGITNADIKVAHNYVGYESFDFTGEGDALLTNQGVYISNAFLFEHINDNGTIFDMANPDSYTFALTGMSITIMNSIGDYNNDGLIDYVVSDIFADNNGDNTGRTYVIDNSSFADLTTTGNTLDVTDTSNTLVQFDGDSTNTTYNSQTYTNTGDINGDDKNDYVFGSDWTAYNGTRSGSVHVVLNFPHVISISTSLDEFVNIPVLTLSGIVNASLSLSTIEGVQWSLSDDPLGAWNECTADDGSFDSLDENYSCEVTGLVDGARTVYVRSYDENTSYTAQSHYANTGVLNVDTVAPSDFDITDADEYTNETSYPFEWDAVDGASYYKIFINGSQHGGNILGTSYTTDLEEGNYEWYVIAYDDARNEKQSTNSSAVIVDRTAPNDSFDNTDFEVVKVDSEEVVEGAAKDDNGNKIGKAISFDRKPKTKFEKIGDDRSGADYYEIRLTKTHDGMDMKDGEDFKWIGDIPHEGDEGQVREREGVEIKYKGDKIEIDPKEGKYKLSKGKYYMKVRVYDRAGNHTDSDEVLLVVKLEEEDPENTTDMSNNSDSSQPIDITLQNIGQIPYTNQHSTYYYTSYLLTLIGEGKGEVVVKIDGKEVQRTNIDGSFKLNNGISGGSHFVEIEDESFTIIVDPSRESFPESLK